MAAEQETERQTELQVVGQLTELLVVEQMPELVTEQGPKLLVEWRLL